MSTHHHSSLYLGTLFESFRLCRERERETKKKKRRSRSFYLSLSLSPIKGLLSSSPRRTRCVVSFFVSHKESVFALIENDTNQRRAPCGDDDDADDDDSSFDDDACDDDDGTLPLVEEL